MCVSDIGWMPLTRCVLLMKEGRGIDIGGVSLWFTGNGIFERSFPMQFFMMDHRLRRFGGLSRMVSLLFAMVGFQSTLKLRTGPVGVCIHTGTCTW